MRPTILAALLCLVAGETCAMDCVTGVPDTGFAPKPDPVVACGGAAQVSMGRLWSIGSTGATRLYVVTPTPPSKSATLEGWVTLSTNDTEDGTPLYPRGVRPICLVTAAWVAPDYANGYDTPDWPNAFFYQTAYDQFAGTVTVEWRLDQALQPHSSYGLNVMCVPRSAPPL